MIYGPKTASFGWDMGTSLKGADGINGTNGTNGANGTNGTNGNTILSGTGVPANTLGNNGDFYINLTNYTIYGPKAGGVWGTGTSLKGADGNANVMSFETADNVTFNWKGENLNSNVLQKQGVAVNDTSTVFTVPVQNFKGSIVVYVRAFKPGGKDDENTKYDYGWKQLNFTDNVNNVGIFIYKTSFRFDAANTQVRIFYQYPGIHATSNLYKIDKVRIVLIPPSSTGIISTIDKNAPLLQTMQKLNIKDSDFIKLK